MGFRGDAVKVTNQDLEALQEIYKLSTTLSAKQREQQVLVKGEELASKRQEILELSSVISQERSKAEEFEREIARIAADLKVVEDRIQKDKDRLVSSSNPKDITGIQHELETLAKRKDSLETAELELMESLESQNSTLDQLLERKRKLEETFESERAFSGEKLNIVQAEILEVSNKLLALRASAKQELLAVFDQRALRGVPIGSLRGSSCGACNMSLTSQAISDLGKIPSDELARCPECGAIMVRA